MSFLERLIEDPERFTRLKKWSCVALGLVLAADVILPLIFHGGHHHFAFEGFPAWGSLYGLISCVAIIVVSKFIGKMGIVRREDHHDR